MAITGQTPISDQEALFRRWNPYSEDNPQQLPEVIVPDKYVDYINDQNPYYYWRSNTTNDLGLNSGGPGHQQYYPWFDRGPVIWDGTRMVYMPEFDPQLYYNPPEVPEKYRMRHIRPSMFGNWIKDKDGRLIRPIETKVIEGDPSENIGNQLLFDALTFYKLPFKVVTNTGKAVFNGVKQGVNTLGKAMLPSEWAKGLASYSRFAPYANQLATVGKWGDALLGSYFAANGINSIGQGLYNNDPSQVAQGSLDIMAATPYGQALKGSKSLMPTIQYTVPAATNILGKVDNFLSSPRTATVGTALTLGGLTAEANNTPRYKPRLDENGNYIYDSNGNIELERDEQGNPIMVYPGLFQGISWDNAEDYLIPTIMAIEGVRGGYKWYVNRKPPRKFTVGTGENATVKYTRDLPEKPAKERPVYQEVSELPSEKAPEAPVAPTPEEFGVRPKRVVPEFTEPRLSDPRNTSRLSNGKNPRDVIKERAAEGTLTSEDIEEFKRLQEAKAAETATMYNDIVAYENQQRRIAEHNQKVAQAEAEYNSQEQVQARDQYQQALDAYNKAQSNYQATYNEVLKNHNEQQRKAFESSIGSKWDSDKALWDEALASPEYRAWQEHQDKVRGFRDWVSNNKWSIGRFGTYGALWLAPKLYRSWRNYNRAIDPELYNRLKQRTGTTTDYDRVDNSDRAGDSARNATGNYIDAIYSSDQTPPQTSGSTTQTPDSIAVPGPLPYTIP